MNPAVATIEPQESKQMLSMIERMATDPNCEPAKLREILAVKQSWEADEARKAFAVDMATFQSKCQIIGKLDTANGRGYARLDRIYRETRPLRTECGLWFIWHSCEVKGEVAYLEGLLGHRSGHTIPCKQVVPMPEEIRGTNATQRSGSAQTYARRYGECAALGIVTGDDNDGNAKPRAGGDELRKFTRELWFLLTSKVAGATDKDKDWNSRNQWLYANDILDGAADPAETVLNCTAERLQEVIKPVKEVK